MTDKYTNMFARRKKTLISPFVLNNEGSGQALVLRYAGCNLKCPLCYAWKYAWLPVKAEEIIEYNTWDCIRALSHLPRVANKKITWVRIQGGEPCLGFDRILHTIRFAAEALIVIHLNNMNYYDITRTVIQTNGIGFSKLNDFHINNIVSQLRNLLIKLQHEIAWHGKIVFEVSFKSPHDVGYLEPQMDGYRVLIDKIIRPLWQEGFNNIAIYPIAGLGPSIDKHNLFIIPVDPNWPDEIPLFHHLTWSERFKQLVNEFFNEIVPIYQAYSDFREKNQLTNEGKKIALEELEPAKFQVSWISGYAGRYIQYGHAVDTLALDKILRKITLDRPTDSQWSKWYNSWVSKKMFGKRSDWFNVLTQIPVSENPDMLLSRVAEMCEYFYPSHPEGHYPYL